MENAPGSAVADPSCHPCLPRVRGPEPEVNPCSAPSRVSAVVAAIDENKLLNWSMTALRVDSRARVERRLCPPSARRRRWAWMSGSTAGADFFTHPEPDATARDCRRGQHRRSRRGHRTSTRSGHVCRCDGPASSRSIPLRPAGRPLPVLSHQQSPTDFVPSLCCESLFCTLHVVSLLHCARLPALWSRPYTNVHQHCRRSLLLSRLVSARAPS